MVEIATVRDYVGTLAGYVYPAVMNGILEDPNPSQGRIFINQNAYDIASLAPVHSKKWHYNLQYSYYQNFGNSDMAPDTNFTQTEAGYNTFYNMSVFGTAYSEGGGNGASYRFPKFISHTYHLTCDPQNYPIRSYLKLQSNNILMCYPPSVSPMSGGTARNTRTFFYPPDITTPFTQAGQNDYNSGISQYTYFPNAMMYEDPNQDVIWGIQTYGNQAAGAVYNSQPICFVRNYQPGTNAASTTTQQIFSTVNYENFWMGNDVYNNPYFFRINKGANNDPVTVSYVNSYTKAGVDILTDQGPSSRYQQLGQNMFPSNVRTVSSTRKAFYTMHYDQFGNLAAMKFDWDPTQPGSSATSVVKTNCTFTYPGSTTFFTYANRPQLGSQQTTVNWHPYGMSWCKAYQFTVGATNYITFTWADHGIMNTSTNYLSRFTSPLQRTWLTFTLGSGTNDYQLTYHSKLTFSQYSDFPRAWIPTVAGGSTLATITATGIKFLTFNATTGWQQSGVYNAGGPCITLGLDSTNRMWGLFADKGSGTIHTITPTSPMTISVVLANNAYTYTGTNISTNAALNVFDSNGNRYAANVSLSIDGTTMTFDDASKVKSYQTSNSADTTVNLVISGGGLNSITSAINI